MSENKSNYRVLRKEACPRCRSKNQDNSGDNLVVYADSDNNESSHCFSCGYTRASKEFKKESYEDRYEYNIEMSGEFTVDMWSRLKETTGVDPRGYRGLTKETCSYYGIRHNFDEMGQVTHQYYPVTKNSELVGIKWRDASKKFTNRGEANADCDLFGQVAFRTTTSKTVVITSGEIDCLSLFQVLRNYTESKGWEPVPVVSSIIGEGGLKQYQNQYEWLNKFDKIIICPDNDAPGQEYLHKIIKVLPRNKLFVMDLPLKDVNECMIKGKEKNIVSEFFKARAYTPSGIKSSDTAFEAMKERAKLQKIDFPDYAFKLNEMLAGGIPLGYIVNIVAGCVDKDTEFLSQNGWKKISEYLDDDLVGQYDTKNDRMSFVIPDNYIKLPCSEFLQFKHRYGLDQVLSEEHRVLVYNPVRKLKEKFYYLSAKELKEKYFDVKKSGDYYFKTTFQYDSNSSLNISEGELRLQVAVMADGRIRSNDKRNIAEMRFVKKRKYDRLIALCKRFSLEYKDLGKKPNSKYKQGFDYNVIVYPKFSDKSFDIKYYNCSSKQHDIILDELYHWDGHLKDLSYGSVHKSDVDFIQFILATKNIRSIVTEDKPNELCPNRMYKYTNSFFRVRRANERRSYVGFSPKTSSCVSVASEDGFKYCFTVPTGNLVLRRNGRIFITGNSGSGKSSIINDFVRHRIYKKDFLCGVVSSEADEAEYGENLFSAHLGKKLGLLDSLEKEAFLNADSTQQEAKNFFTNIETGEPTYYIIDDRGDFDTIQSKIEELIVKCGCKVLIIDVLTDLFAGRDNSYQEKFLAFEKSLVKEYKVAIINIVHTRKGAAGQQSASSGAMLDEESMIGSGAQYRSGGINLSLRRNKLAEDEITRNTLEIYCTKSRSSGKTGLACSLFYEGQSATFFDLEEYKQKNPELFEPTESTY